MLQASFPHSRYWTEVAPKLSEVLGAFSCLELFCTCLSLSLSSGTPFNGAEMFLKVLESQPKGKPRVTQAPLCPPLPRPPQRAHPPGGGGHLRHHCVPQVEAPGARGSRRPGWLQCGVLPGGR